MKESWKIAVPAVTACTEASLEETVAQALDEDGDIIGRCFRDETLEAVSGRTLDFSGCRFERCTFGEWELSRLSFVDCVFEKCEWSNARLENCTLQRVEFHHCRLTGAEWLRGTVINVLFDGCMMDYASFSETKLDRVFLRDCRMRESLWADVKLSKARFEGTDLRRAQWIRTPLMGQDMSSCEIGGWNISLFDLKGVKVTAQQLIELSGLLGVEIV